jgi:hypothetical protein
VVACEFFQGFVRDPCEFLFGLERKSPKKDFTLPSPVKTAFSGLQGPRLFAKNGQTPSIAQARPAPEHFAYFTKRYAVKVIQFYSVKLQGITY